MAARDGTAASGRLRAWLAAGSACLLLLAACETSAAGDAERPHAVATINVIADLVAEVAGDRVDVSSVVPLGGDPHTYEATPSDARLVSDADVVFRNGLGLERWLDQLVDATAGGVVVTVTEGLDPAWDEEAGAVDPHLWMDPLMVVRYVEVIRAALTDLDPGGARAYEQAAAAYVDALHQLDAWIAEQVETVPPERRKLVTTHDAFRYFGERYGLDVVGTIWGTSTEREPSADEIRRLVDAVRDEGVPAVFVETTVSPRLMERVARDAGVRVGEPLYGDSLGAAGSGADTYLGMMRANTSAIVAGLRE